jgi:hypothetical protein
MDNTTTNTFSLTKSAYELLRCFILQNRNQADVYAWDWENKKTFDTVFKDDIETLVDDIVFYGNAEYEISTKDSYDKRPHTISFCEDDLHINNNL